MCIKWEKLYDVCGKNNKLSGMEFEKIVLEYLSEYYPQYSWKQTQASWDNNRDFFSLILDNIYAEAKYKKNSSALKKQDVDPTMMSGLLDGNVEIIFFITNGYLPSTIMQRLNQVALAYSFKIICITKIQLEYWLLLRPNIYEKYFKEKLNFDNKLTVSCIINSIEITDYDNSSNILSVKQELLENHFYIMNIVFESNDVVNIKIVNNNYPFSFIDAPGYNTSSIIQVSPGIQQIQLLIYTDKCETNTIELKYCINNKDTFSFLINICIYPNLRPTLVYNEQLVYKEEIINTLNCYNAKGQIITLTGKKGTGKTYLLNDILKHFYQSRQIIYFKFYSENDYRNKMLICRIIIYINFGEIVKIFNFKDAEFSINYYKSLIKSKLDPIHCDIDLVLQIFEGCFDEIIADKVIGLLFGNKNKLSKIIVRKNTPISHLVLIDDFNLLNDSENIVLNKIINDTIKCNNTSFLISTLVTKDSEFYNLDGLSCSDIQNSLKFNFKNWTDSFVNIIYKQFSNIPNLFCETIQYIKMNLKGNTDEEKLLNYIMISDRKLLSCSFDFDFNLPDEYKAYIGFIYLFDNGVNIKILEILGIAHEKIVNIIKSGYTQINCDKISAYSELYRKIFVEKFEKEYKNTIISYLDEIINMPGNYSEYIFIPDLYVLYFKYKEENDSNLYSKIQSKLYEYSYQCDYKNLYAYGKVAYYFISKKEVGELTENDFVSLFYYGISLLHCDRKRGAIEIFRYIKNNASPNFDIYYMASCELYNNLYNLYQVNGLHAEILITKLELERKIKKIKDENSQSALNIRIAYSTCLNRYMMISFMQDNYGQAKNVFEIYRKYHKQIPTSKYSEKYNSMLGEWNLDYARGISYINSDEAKTYFEESIPMICEKLNRKRYLLAKLDLAFYECVYSNDYDSQIDSIHSIVMLLKENGYENEYIRGIIRENLCTLIYYIKTCNIVNLSGMHNVINKMKEQALLAELDTMVYLNGRLAYQVRDYFAALDIVAKDYDSAKNYLHQNLDMIKDAGDSYKKIIRHNLTHIYEINTISWGLEENFQNTNSYLVDPRIW